MNFLILDGGEPLKRMRTLANKTKSKIAREKKNLKKNFKKRLTLGVVNLMLAMSLVASYNPITVVRAQEVVPITTPEEPESVEKDFSLIHIVSVETKKATDSVDKTNNEPTEIVEKIIKKQTVKTANLYPWGQCTYYVKSKRADIPNRMGNARYWFGSAKANGLETGNQARVGAIMVTDEGPYGHVAIVEGFKNGKMVISEMNFLGVGVVSQREIDLSSNYVLGYIY